MFKFFCAFYKNIKTVCNKNVFSHYRLTSSRVDQSTLEKKRKFWEQEKQIEDNVDYSRLTDSEKNIHECHKQAVLKGHFTYDDPEMNTREFTRLRHFLRGVCCGNACRHCIYDHAKVAEFKKKTRRFNTAFWVYDQLPDGTQPFDELDDKIFKLKIPKSRPT